MMTEFCWRKALLVLLSLALLCRLAAAAAAVTVRSDCVERSLCYHSTDCCNGCCEDHQCVSGGTSEQCGDHGVARNCSTLTCTQHQECEQETRFCLIAPCPQPLPKCVPKKPPSPPRDADVPLPVQYN